MKRLLIVVLVVVFATLSVACNGAPKRESDVSKNAPQTVLDTESESNSKIVPYIIPESVYASDGIIEPLDEKGLITKLSKLKEGMLLDDVIALFGKEPFAVKESGEDIFVYFSGDITITLWGTSLYQVNVKYNDFGVSIELGNHISL